jgi:SAM-dependent methyltransferase
VGPAPARPPVPRASVEHIRRTRGRPRWTDPLYLHLERLLRDLRSALEGVEARDVLDLYCGARPYADLLPEGARCVGFDIDDSYGCADVVSHEFLPFPDGSFDLVLCTQAFYFVPDPVAGVREIARVLRPRGRVVLTLPVVYPGTERLYTATQLAELFEGWDEVAVVAQGGTAASTATLANYLLYQSQKRLPRPARLVLTPLVAACYLTVNWLGVAGDRLERRFLRGADSLPTN